MEGIGYTVRWKILGAHSVLSPHIRQRLYWVANRESERRTGMVTECETGIGEWSRVGCSGPDGRVADAGQLASRDANPGKDFRESYQPQDWRGKANDDVAGRFGFGRLGDTNNAGLEGRGERGQRSDELPVGSPMSPWDDSILIPCRDGKARRLKPGLEPLVAGLPGRVALLRGAGNAIVPQVAAAFIRAFLETEKGTCRYGEERLDH
jgi:DNA (cytosine-5)-methyltransferase 1